MKRKICSHGISPLRNCKECMKTQHREWRKNNPEKIREYRRKHILGTGKKYISGLNKRDYPADNKCEICGRFQPRRLAYHHWDNKNPNWGIWVCLPCHKSVEFIDKGFGELYLQLKQQIEEKWIW